VIGRTEAPGAWRGATAAGASVNSGDEGPPRWRNIGEWRNETVAAPRQRLDIARRLGRVIQNLANPGHGIIQTVIEIHEGIGWPQLRLQFLTRDDFAGTFNQDRQYLKRLPRKAQPHPVFAEFTRLRVYLKNAKAADDQNLRCVRHTTRKCITGSTVSEAAFDLLRDEGLTF
jgi:hypothetical protein